MPKGFQVPEGSGDVGPARAAPLSGLMHGEHRLNDGTNDVHEGRPEDPAQSDGQLEGPLTGGSIGTFLLGDPDTEIFVWAEDFNACGPAERSHMEGLADKEGGEGYSMVI